VANPLREEQGFVGVWEMKWEEGKEDTKAGFRAHGGRQVGYRWLLPCMCGDMTASPGRLPLIPYLKLQHPQPHAHMGSDPFLLYYLLPLSSFNNFPLTFAYHLPLSTKA
jgi:hypothetical protein